MSTARSLVFLLCTGAGPHCLLGNLLHLQEMFLNTVSKHVRRIGSDEQAAVKPANEGEPEMLPDMIVEGTMTARCEQAEWAKPVVHLYQNILPFDVHGDCCTFQAMVRGPTRS